MSIYETFDFNPDPLFLKVGVVKSLENSNDKEHKDRILVSFFYEESECYASMMYSYFGEKFGKVWYPDPGTIVVVAFLYNCLDCAIIIGCLNKYEENLLPITEENNTEIIKHKNGSTLEFFNKENESKITVTTKDEKEKITIDLDNENIQINNKDETSKFIFDFKESKISLKSKELCIELEEGINIKGKNINIDLDNKLTFKGNGLSMETNGEMQMKSNGSIEIKSNMVNIN